MAIMYEMHAGADIMDELTAKRLSGHIGINKTVEHIASRYYWPDINGLVHKYVNTCLVCQIAKERSNKKTSRTMTPVPIPPKSHVANRYRLDDDGTIQGHDLHNICSGLFYEIL